MSALNLLILLPFIGSAVLFLMSAFSKVNLKVFAFFLSLSSLVILAVMHQSILTNVINIPWFNSLSIDFHLKADALSMVFLFVTSIILPISILLVKINPTVQCALILFLQGTLLVFFTARDLAVFTIFWEATLLPLYFIITLFSHEKGKKTALKFIIYMIAGSCLMVAAVLSLYFSYALSFGEGTFNLDVLKEMSDTLPHAKWLFAIFLLAFAVKTPTFPFHGWLADTYSNASITGTILLSAVLSKLGIYGFFRIGMGLFPVEMNLFAPYLTSLAIFSVLYGAFAAWGQKDYKRLIAYASFSHVNFILVGVFVLSETARSGALLQVINHSITITGLFLVAHFLQQRIHTTVLDEYQGLAKYLPRLCWLTLIFVMASIALPGTNNFIGDLLIFIGLFETSFIKAAVLALSTVLAAIYMLRYMQLNFFGKDAVFHENYVDIGKKEIILLLPLIMLIFLIGIYPQIVLKHLEAVR